MSASTVECNNCSQSIQESSNFCPGCGHARASLTPYSGPILQTTSTSNEKQKTLEKEAWSTFKHCLVLYSIFLGCSLVYGLVSRATVHPMTEVIFWLVLIIVTGYFSFVFKSEISPLLRLKRPKLIPLLEILLIAILCYYTLVLYFNLLGLMIPMAKTSNNIVSAGWPVWSAFVLVSFLPGVVEEFAFRGVIYTHLKKVLSQKEALFIQAACFSVLHLAPAIYISHFIMGFFLGWVREKSDGLYLPIFFHMAWNAYIVGQELGVLPFTSSLSI